jgi:lipoate-protein ligase B
MMEGRLIDIERMEYEPCLALLRGLAEARRQAYGCGEPSLEFLILTEHPPVVTMGRRTEETDIVAPPRALTNMGVTVHRIERGGLATFHGPGQVMVYPVVHLPSVRLGLADFVNRLEEAVIRTLGDFEIEAGRKAGRPGVWVGPLKIASLGLAVRRSVTIHGLALNVNTDLSFFNLINPCGLTASTMTSMKTLLGRPMDLAEVRSGLAVRFAETIGLELKPWPESRAQEYMEKYGQTYSQASVA